MDPNAIMLVLLKLAAVLLLVLVNGFFVAAEFALVKIRDTQLIPFVVKGNRRAKIALGIIKHLAAALSATQLGITLSSLGLGWFAEPIFATILQPVMKGLHIQSEHLQHSLSFAIGFSVITFLHIVAGELAPKSMAIQKPLQISLWVAMPLSWFYRISYPFIWVLNHSALWLLGRFGIEGVSGTELVHSEDELRLLFATAQKQGSGSALGRSIVLNALDLRRRVVREVMRPRQEIVGLDTEATMAESLEVAEKTRYSRFPLCEGGDIDKTRGVVHFKDLFALRSRPAVGRDLIPIARKIIYVPETARLEKLLQLFLDRKVHFAIVVDEYGGTVGMVTLENILEELVGQIQDEFDQEKPLLVKKDEHTWEVDGALPLHELGELVGENLQEESITTANGWVTHKLGGFPKPGDLVSVGAFELRVEMMDGVRVQRMQLTRKPEPVNAPE